MSVLLANKTQEKLKAVQSSLSPRQFQNAKPINSLEENSSERDPLALIELSIANLGKLSKQLRVHNASSIPRGVDVQTSPYLGSPRPLAVRPVAQYDLKHVGKGAESQERVGLARFGCNSGALVGGHGRALLLPIA